MANLYALEHLFVTTGVVEVGVVGCEHRGIHLGHRVDILSEVEAEDGAELTHLEEFAGVHVEFPAFVFHLTDVGSAERGVTTG